MGALEEGTKYHERIAEDLEALAKEGTRLGHNKHAGIFYGILGMLCRPETTVILSDLIAIQCEIGLNEYCEEGEEKR